MTRSQALELARDAVGTQWRDAVTGVRYKGAEMNARMLAVLNLGKDHIILRGGNLSTLTDTRIAMVKVLTLQNKLMEDFAGQPATLELVSTAIFSLNERFLQECMSNRSVLVLSLVTQTKRRGA